MGKRILWYGVTFLLVMTLIIRNATLDQSFTTWDTLLLGVFVALNTLFIAIDMSFWLPFGKTLITGAVFIGFIVLMFEYDGIPIEGGAIIIFPASVLMGIIVLINIIHIVSKPFRR